MEFLFCFSFPHPPPGVTGSCREKRKNGEEIQNLLEEKRSGIMIIPTNKFELQIMWWTIKDEVKQNHQIKVNVK